MFLIFVFRNVRKGAFPISYLQHNQNNFLDGLKKLEQRSHKWVELRGEYVE
jgi:hypothetical protein